MINILTNQKRGLNGFSKLLDDGDPWEPNAYLTKTLLLLLLLLLLLQMFGERESKKSNPIRYDLGPYLLNLSVLC